MNGMEISSELPAAATSLALGAGKFDGASLAPDFAALLQSTPAPKPAPLAVAGLPLLTSGEALPPVPPLSLTSVQPQPTLAATAELTDPADAQPRSQDAQDQPSSATAAKADGLPPVKAKAAPVAIEAAITVGLVPVAEHAVQVLPPAQLLTPENASADTEMSGAGRIKESGVERQPGPVIEFNSASASLPILPTTITQVLAEKSAGEDSRQVTADPASPAIASFDLQAQGTLLERTDDQPQNAKALPLSELPGHDTTDLPVEVAPDAAAPLIDTPAVTAELRLGKSQPFAPPEPPRLTLGGDFGERLGLAITTRLGEGGNEVQIRMDPAELGRIHVRLTFDEGGSLRAVVGAESAQVLDTIRRDLADLQRTLAEAGVRTDAQSFRFDRGGHSGGGDGALPRPWRHGRGEADGQGATPDEEPPRYRPLRSVGRVDLMA